MNSWEGFLWHLLGVITGSIVICALKHLLEGGVMG